MTALRLHPSRAVLLLFGLLSGCRSTSLPPAPIPCGDDIAGQALLASSLVLVGELHGTAEIPAALGHLACQAAVGRPGETILVGLEIPSSTQPAVDAFLASDGGAQAVEALLAHEHWQREYQDGRSSAAMLDLLEGIRGYRKAGLKIEVRAIDPGRYDSPNDRDAGMASTLSESIESIHPAQTLVLVGNVHSRSLKGYPWNAEADFMPLGAHLRTRYAGLIALDIAVSGGSAWICTSAAASECGPHPQGSRDTPGPLPRIELDPAAAPGTGYDGVLSIGPVTASPPAVP